MTPITQHITFSCIYMIPTKNYFSIAVMTIISPNRSKHVLPKIAKHTRLGRTTGRENIRVRPYICATAVSPFFLITKVAKSRSMGNNFLVNDYLWRPFLFYIYYWLSASGFLRRCRATQIYYAPVGVRSLAFVVYFASLAPGS